MDNICTIYTSECRACLKYISGMSKLTKKKSIPTRKSVIIFIFLCFMFIYAYLYCNTQDG